MKILTIPEENSFEPGLLNPACEGFVDMMYWLFPKMKRKNQKPPSQQENAEALRKSNSTNYEKLNERLETDIAATFENPDWVQKVIAGKTGLIRVAGLKGANYDGKEITSPKELLKIANDMSRAIDEIVRREEPFTKLRQSLVDQIAKSSNPNETASALWLKYKDRLTQICGERFLQSSKRSYPCISHNSKTDGEWPVAFKTKGQQGYNCYAYEETSGLFEAPNEKNAESFVEAIRGFMKLTLHLQEQYQDNQLTYWEDGACDYDNLEYADEIYDRIYYSQAVEEIHFLLYCARETFARMTMGLYIAMYDRHDKSVK